jgi:hypothetical protein
MRLGLSVAADDRRFARALRRVRPAFDSLCQEFEAIRLAHPIHEAVLVGVANGLPDAAVREVPNDDGFFQVLVGLGPADEVAGLPTAALASRSYDRVRAAVLTCPFSAPDRDAVERLLSDWAARNLPR